MARGDNDNLMDRLRQMSEEGIAGFFNEIMSNDRMRSSFGKAGERFMANKQSFDRNVEQVLDFVNIPSKRDVRDLKARLDHLSSQLLNLSIKLDRMLDQHDAYPSLAGEAPDDRTELIAHSRRQPDRRLVEQQQRRIGGERADDLDHALLPAGQLGGRAVLEVRDVHEAEQVAGPCGCPGFQLRRQTPPEQQPEEVAVDLRVEPYQDILQHRQRRKQPDILKRPRHPKLQHPVRLQPQQLPPAEPDRPLRRHQPGPGDDRSAREGPPRSRRHHEVDPERQPPEHEAVRLRHEDRRHPQCRREREVGDVEVDQATPRPADVPPRADIEQDEHRADDGVPGGEPLRPAVPG